MLFIFQIKCIQDITKYSVLLVLLLDASFSRTLTVPGNKPANGPMRTSEYLAQRFNGHAHTESQISDMTQIYWPGIGTADVLFLNCRPTSL